MKMFRECWGPPYLKNKISVATFQSFKSFTILKFQRFKVPKFQTFKISKFQIPKIKMYGTLASKLSNTPNLEFPKIICLEMIWDFLDFFECPGVSKDKSFWFWGSWTRPKILKS